MHKFKSAWKSPFLHKYCPYPVVLYTLMWMMVVSSPYRYTYNCAIACTSYWNGVYTSRSQEPCRQDSTLLLLSFADPASIVQGDQWEEKWGEHYWSKGKAQKWADKWGKEGTNVWHERWGEDYPPGGDACFKYTDKAGCLPN